MATPGFAAAMRASAADEPLAACEAEGSATVNLVHLWKQLYPADLNDTTGSKVQSCISRIDTDMGSMPGYLAVRNAADMIGSDAQALGTRITGIGRAIERVHSCAGNSNSRDLGLYIDADLSQTQNNAALQQLIALKKVMTQLQAELTKTYAVDANWVGSDQKQFRLNTTSITPTLELMQNVTVKVVSVNFQYDSSTGALTILSQDAGSVKFQLRRYSILTPEIGTGAVFGTITKPVYGTEKNKDGQTVVAKTGTSSLSVNPGLMVNFVCRCSTGPLAPMAQIGTAISKDIPGILLGLGTRLFGLG